MAERRLVCPDRQFRLSAFWASKRDSYPLVSYSHFVVALITLCPKKWIEVHMVASEARTSCICVHDFAPTSIAISNQWFSRQIMIETWALLSGVSMETSSLNTLLHFLCFVVGGWASSAFASLWKTSCPLELWSILWVKSKLTLWHFLLIVQKKKKKKGLFPCQPAEYRAVLSAVWIQSS